MKIEKPNIVGTLSQLEVMGFLRPAGSPLIPPGIGGFDSALTPREVRPSPFLPANLRNVEGSFEELNLSPFLDHISSDDFEPSTIGVATKSKEWDAAAWYCPAHFYGFEWGIYVRIKSVYEIALDILNTDSPAIAAEVLVQTKNRVLWVDKQPHLSDEHREAQRHATEVASEFFGPEYRGWLSHEGKIIQAIKAAYFLLYHHELFHHLVESLGIRMECITERPVYVSYQDSVYKVAKGTPDLFEEALANAFAYRAAEQLLFGEFLSRKPGGDQGMRDACLQYLRDRFPTDPPGYNRALEFVSNGDFEIGLGLLMAQIKQAKVNPVGGTQHNPVLAAELDPLFGEDNVRCVEVSDAEVHRILPDAATPFDNRGKRLQKLAERHGFSLKRQGEHEVWAKPGSAPLPIPRTKTVADGTAESILKKMNANYRLRNIEEVERSTGVG